MGEKQHTARTLYVRLPHTIHNPEEVRNLFPIDVDVKVKLPRQSSRRCHVMFTSAEDAVENLEILKNKTINDKRIFARLLNQQQSGSSASLSTILNKKCSRRIVKKFSEKKIVIPQPKPEPKITQTLYVCNINQKSKISDLKEIFGEVRTIAFIKSKKINDKRNDDPPTKEAIVKLADGKLAAEYIKKERPWPCLHGNKLKIKPDKRKHKKKKSSQTEQ